MKKLLLATTILASLASVNANAGATHKGTIEGGFSAARGNTDNDNLNGKLGLTSTAGKIVNEFVATGFGAKSGGTRSGENYNVNDKLKYEFDTVNYAFGEGDWANNRFAGFDERLTGLGGLGHYFFKEPNLTLFGEVGVGYRTTDYIPINQEDEESAVGKVAGGLNWKINEYVEFGQTLSSVFGESNVVTISDTSIKSFLNKDLYLKFGYNLQNQSDVPAANKETDTITTFSVGYNF